MRLNKRGYMLVEIIVSFGIAFAIIMSLTNLIIKFKDVNTDIYYSTNFLKDKTLITRSIMEDLQKGKIVEARVNDNTIDFEFRIRENDTFIEEQRRLQAIKNGGVTKIVYGKIIDDSYDKNDVSYYEKTLASSLNVSNMNIINNDTSIILNIAITSLYSDEVYDINFFSEVVDERKLYQIYTLTFDATGGEVTPTSKDIRYNDFYGELPEPTREGYNFLRWYDDFYNYKRTITKDMIVTEKRDQLLKAEWKIKTFIVTFDANGGAVADANKEVTYGEGYGELPIPTRSGYVFEGWYTEINGGELVNESTIVKLSANQILYAKWSADSYELTFDGNGGTPSYANKEVTYDTEYGELPTATRSGYEFTGWYTEETGGSIVISDTIVKITSDQTLYAHWSDVEYVVTFDGTGGTPSNNTKTVNKGGTYGELPSVSRSGYEFLGWYTEPSGGTKIDATTNITQNNDHTLYARWQEATYIITFNSNGGTPDLQTRTVTYNGTYGTLPEVTREGYTFDGWYTEVDGGTKITSSTKVTITSDQTLYAKWNVNNYTVTFDLGYVDGKRVEGSVEPSSITVTYGETYGELPQINGELYLENSEVSERVFVPQSCVTSDFFLGWYTEIDGGEKITSDTIVTITSSQTLYAHWSGYTNYCGNPA